MPLVILLLWALAVVASVAPRSTRHALVKRLGLWPWYGRVSFAYYAWANRQIRPTNPDAHRVGRRYAALRAEFSPTLTER